MRLVATAQQRLGGREAARLCYFHPLGWLIVANRVREQQGVSGEFLRVLIPIALVQIVGPGVVTQHVLQVGHLIVLPVQNLQVEVKLITAAGQGVVFNQKYL